MGVYFVLNSFFLDPSTFSPSPCRSFPRAMLPLCPSHRPLLVPTHLQQDPRLHPLHPHRRPTTPVRTKVTYLANHSVPRSWRHLHHLHAFRLSPLHSLHSLLSRSQHPCQVCFLHQQPPPTTPSPSLHFSLYPTYSLRPPL